jgi:hypothetical protein
MEQNIQTNKIGKNVLENLTLIGPPKDQTINQQDPNLKLKNEVVPVF